MKILAPTLAALLLTTSTALAQSDADKAAVLSVFDSWNLGWAERDAAMAVRDYAEDADWTNAFGDRLQGRDALREGLEYVFSLDFVMTGSSRGNDYADVTFLSPDIALIRSKLVRTGQRVSTGELMPDRHIHHLRVLRRNGERWEIVSHLISQAHEKR